MRDLLDGLYRLAGGLAAGLIAFICLIVSAQVVLNIVTRLGGTAVSYTIPSYADFAGYCLAASSFLALAYTFTRDGHIRVMLVLDRLPGRAARLAAELFALLACGAATLFATYYIALLTAQSYRFGDKSTGIVAIPLWIPQSVVLLGLAILSIALLDSLVQTLRTGRPAIEPQQHIE
ncbi:TRAP transporter small permease [Fulvimarina sp. MAC8]|uniref:TRAP transporter small permease n=1 Tax=Fulvimarina sp. MAC8 TaxID=3162874 RepID=UPI0032ED9055